MGLKVKLNNKKDFFHKTTLLYETVLNKIRKPAIYKLKNIIRKSALLLSALFMKKYYYKRENFTNLLLKDIFHKKIA